MKPTHFSARPLLLASSCAILFSSTLHAATHDFTGGTSAIGGWGTASSWQGGVLPTFNTVADLKFGVNFPMTTNASWLGNANRTARSLEFGNITTDLTINLGSDNGTTTARVLTLDSDAGNATITVNSSVTANVTIGPAAIGNMTLADDLVVTNNSTTSTLNLNRPITETGGAKNIVKEGVGVLQLTGTNTFTGKTTVNGGILRINTDSRLGTAPGSVVADQLTLNGGTLRTYATFALAANRGITLGVNGGGIDAPAGVVTYNGTITGPGSLTITGATTSQVVELGGVNDYQGGTVINSGTLRLLAAGTIVSNHNVTINGAAANFNVRNTAGWTHTGSITGDGLGAINLNTATNATLAGNISGIANITANSVGTNTTISGDVSGGTNLTITGGATLTLAGDNSSTGLVALNGATADTQLNLKSATALGTGIFQIAGGNNAKFDNTSGSALTLTSNNPQNWNSDFAFVGSNDLNLGTGTATLGGNRAITVSANTLTVGAITGAFGLTKQGGGTLLLSGNSDYSGTTTVSTGTLRLDGSHTGGDIYTVASGGKLQGTGTTTSALSVSGVLSPGASIQSFASGALSLLDGSTFQAELDSTAALTTAADLQLASGDLSLTGLVNLDLADLATSPTAFALGTTFSLINYTGTWNGGLFTHNSTLLPDDATFSAGLNVWQIQYDATAGGSNFASEHLAGSSFVNLVAIPEPRTSLLGGIGLLILLRRRR